MVIILGLWASWFFFSHVRLYKISTAAQVELDRSTYAIEAQTSGRVTRHNAQLAQNVEQGDVLIELDSEIYQLRLEEKRAHKMSLGRQVNALKREVATHQRILEQQEQAATATVKAAKARHREAGLKAELTSKQVARDSVLYQKGLLSALELLESKTEAKKQRAATEALLLDVGSVEKELQGRQSRLRADMQRLKRQETATQGDIEVAAAQAKQLENEIEKRRVRAPARGSIGELAKFQVGSVVSEGEGLGMIVSPGTLIVVAEFAHEAVGRIKAGLPAQLRLDAFPWTQFGTVPLKVVRVASQTRDQHLRVELCIEFSTAVMIPLEHGLGGTVEVELEQVTPANLLLRTIGRRPENTHNARVSPNKTLTDR